MGSIAQAHGRGMLSVLATIALVAACLMFWSYALSLFVDVIGSRASCQAENPGKVCRIRWEPTP